MRQLTFLFIFLSLTISCLAYDYPDKGGLVNFDHPREVRNRIFVMTNPKSGTHLLTLGITKLTGRITRNRHQYHFWMTNKDFQRTENPLDLLQDFSKETIYKGHEYEILGRLNHNQNKLIFVLRDFKDNICSILTGDYRLNEGKMEQLDKLFRYEVMHERYVFTEYINRLKLFDRWNEKHKLIIPFSDLVQSPEKFVPKLTLFIGDGCDYQSFIAEYDIFKALVKSKYNEVRNNTAFSKGKRFYRDHLSESTIREVDAYIQRRHSKLWKKYLKDYAN